MFPYGTPLSMCTGKTVSVRLILWVNFKSTDFRYKALQLFYFRGFFFFLSKADKKQKSINIKKQ